MFIILVSDDVSDADGTAVIPLGNLHVQSGVGRVHDLAVADVDGDVAAVVNQVAGAGFGVADLLAGVALIVRSSGKGDAVLRVDQFGEAGAVGTGLQAQTAVHVLQLA